MCIIAIQWLTSSTLSLLLSLSLWVTAMLWNTVHNNSGRKFRSAKHHEPNRNVWFSEFFFSVVLRILLFHFPSAAKVFAAQLEFHSRVPFIFGLNFRDLSRSVFFYFHPLGKFLTAKRRVIFIQRIDGFGVVSIAFPCAHRDANWLRRNNRIFVELCALTCDMLNRHRWNLLWLSLPTNTLTECIENWILC